MLRVVPAMYLLFALPTFAPAGAQSATPVPTPNESQSLCFKEASQAEPVKGSPSEVIPPKPRKYTQPKWPKAPGCKAAPAVAISAVIMPGGRLCGATVTSSVAPECQPFAQAALEATKDWTFTPAKKDGKPVAVMFSLTTNFTRAPAVQP